MQKNLDGDKVVYFFKEISKIPRGSYNEKQISDYLVDFAKIRGLSCYQDDSFNCIIKKPAYPSYEGAPAVILQSHVDMVCEKNKDVEHDFENEGINIIMDGDIIKANGTTLGADNGIGVAITLAILDSDDIPHPPLEAVFTTSEEVGLLGASKLAATELSGRVLINIDSEREGVFTCGCAGGLKACLCLPAEYEAAEMDADSFLLFVKGLKGGHSGNDITKERANANILLGRMLAELKDIVTVSSVSGGVKDNAIPREAEAVINVRPADIAGVKERIDGLLKVFNREYRNTESISVSFEECGRKDKCFTAATLQNILAAMLLTPNGVMSMSTDIEGLPESSTNLGVVVTNGAEVTFTSAVRSSVVSKKHFIVDRIKLLAAVTGGSVSISGEYPSWEFNPDSKLRELFILTYEEMYGVKPQISVIHAGLECGVFAEKIAGADIISMGLDMRDIHTPDERVSISSIKRCWEFLKMVLERMK